MFDSEDIEKIPTWYKLIYVIFGIMLIVTIAIGVIWLVVWVLSHFMPMLCAIAIFPIWLILALMGK